MTEPEPQTTPSQAPPPPPAVSPPTAGDSGAGQASAQAAEQASLPPSQAKPEAGQSIRILFASDASDLPDSAKKELADVVARIRDDPSLRLQLLAYAGGESLSPSKARRLSLSRALSARTFLIENGLRSTRIDVRALGDTATDEPVNRVDINVIER